MVEILKRESVYLYYYLSIQLRLIAPYWVLGIFIGSAVSVFLKGKILTLFLKLRDTRLGLLGILPASLLGIASPLCLFGTLPIVSTFSGKGFRDDWLAAFMMSSILLNPQLLVYSAVLGRRLLILRFVFALLCGLAAGLLVRIFFRNKPLFSFRENSVPQGRDTDPNLFYRFLKNLWRNIKATGPYFLIGILLTALYQRYVPGRFIAGLFGAKHRGFGVLTAAALGVPLYVCGGGTIPLLVQWLQGGMSQGSAVAFMLTGPATKITNLSALKSAFTVKNFVIYCLFVFFFAAAAGLLTDLLLPVQ